MIPMEVLLSVSLCIEKRIGGDVISRPPLGMPVEICEDNTNPVGILLSWNSRSYSQFIMFFFHKGCGRAELMTTHGKWKEKPK